MSTGEKLCAVCGVAERKTPRSVMCAVCARVRELESKRVWKARHPERAWEVRYPEKAKAYSRARRQRPEEKEKKRLWNRGDPKQRARKRVETAVLSGRLAKPPACSDCGVTGKIEGHHEDYSKPLDVVWLCSKCHGARHRINRRAVPMSEEP